jgi:phosphomannomutase/phosphoglucomutase
MKREIFREYDIRGVVDQDLDLLDAERIGKGFGTYLHHRGGRSALVGRDCRLSSPSIRDALVKGLVASGIQVVDAGVCPTPAFYFGLRHFSCDGGLMITASHNPPEYNGFKVCLGPDTLFGEEIQKFRQMIEAGEFRTAEGSVATRDVISPYVDWVSHGVSLNRPVRLAVDAGNGTGGITAGSILRRLGCRPQELFFEMDGTFPNHEPDPTVPENLETLVQTVVENGLELGIGLDGDADRIGVVDEKGRIIYGDMLLVIFAREILREKPGSTIIGEVKCSQRLYDDIRAHGGHPIMWRTGHSLIKQKLKEEGAALAGEMSGHIFFAHRYFGYDDAVYAACRLLEILAKSERPLSHYLADLPKMYNTPEIRIPCPESVKFQVVERVKEELAKAHPVIDVDGVRVVFPQGWGLVRASNTGPILVLRFEAESESRLKEIRSLVETTLDKIRQQL